LEKIMANFIDNLQVAPDIKHKLRSLGVSSAPALLSLVQASPEYARAFLGDSVDTVTSQLEDTLTSDEQAVLLRRPPRFGLGAIVGVPAPAPALPNYDIDERDRIFSELQQLRNRGQLSETSRARITELEEKLNAMLQR
jgi:hypothetical protein